MSQPISIGLDFGSLKYRAAYVLEGAVIPVPVPAADRTWVGLIMLQPTQTGLTFSSLKHELGTGQPMSHRGGKETVEDIVRDNFINIKASVEEYAGEDAERVVISVPARYSAFRRSETLKIAKAAGFSKAALINDCAAAALGYTFDEGMEAATLLVYSIGFIGFEVSLLRIAKGRLREIAHEGAKSPSGRDFDVWIMGACVRQLGLNTRTYTSHWFDLRAIASEAKHQLAVNDETVLSLPTYITGTEPKDILLQRADFEDAITSEIQASTDLIDRILEDANLKHADVDKVILVGGSTRINYIQRQLEDKFGPKLIQPRDDILARGAAVQAFKLTDEDWNAVPSSTEVVVEEAGEETTPISTTTVQPVQRESTKDVLPEPQRLIEAPPDELETTQPDIEALFDYVQRLLDSKDYEKADEFTKSLLKRVETARRELRKVRQ